jgi:hypothetical protein
VVKPKVATQPTSDFLASITHLAICVFEGSCLSGK